MDKRHVQKTWTTHRGRYNTGGLNFLSARPASFEILGTRFYLLPFNFDMFFIFIFFSAVHFNYPSFSGHSYIAYDTIKGFLQVSVEMEFQASSSEGLLFYNGQMDDGSGDFIALVLVGDHVELQ